MLSEKAISEFKEIYKLEFGVELEFSDASELANKFMEFFKVVYRPIELKEQPIEVKV